MSSKITKRFLKHVLDQYQYAYDDIKKLNCLSTRQIALTNYHMAYGMCCWVGATNKYFHRDFYHFCTGKGIHNEALAPYPKRARNKTQVLKYLQARINWLKEQSS